LSIPSHPSHLIHHIPTPLLSITPLSSPLSHHSPLHTQSPLPNSQSPITDSTPPLPGFSSPSAISHLLSRLSIQPCHQKTGVQPCFEPSFPLGNIFRAGGWVCSPGPGARGLFSTFVRTVGGIVGQWDGNEESRKGRRIASQGLRNNKRKERDLVIVSLFF
jgi:hypothetical protein